MISFLNYLPKLMTGDHRVKISIKVPSENEMSSKKIRSDEF